MTARLGLGRAVCLIIFSAALPATAGEATYLMRGGPEPATVKSNGFVQTVTPLPKGGWRVQVSVAFDPIGASGSWSLPVTSRPTGVPAGFDLPVRLQRTLRRVNDPWNAATEILRWVATHVEVDDRDQSPQDATSVLRKGRGRCSGIANAATALLRRAGFEARTVSGLLVSGRHTTAHRWIECQLPGAGWVPSDPTLGLWVVTPQHVVFADAVAEPPVVEIEQSTWAGLPNLPRDRGRPIRPNHGAGLICRLAQPGHAMAVLSRGRDEVRRAVLDPEGRFDGLLPGRWTLVVENDGRVLETYHLRLEAGRVHTFTIDNRRSGSTTEDALP
jgi:hypothetical protein